MGKPFPSPGDLPNLGIGLRSPALQPGSSPSEPPGKPWCICKCIANFNTKIVKQRLSFDFYWRSSPSQHYEISLNYQSFQWAQPRSFFSLPTLQYLFNSWKGFKWFLSKPFKSFKHTFHTSSFLINDLFCQTKTIKVILLVSFKSLQLTTHQSTSPVNSSLTLTFICVPVLIVQIPNHLCLGYWYCLLASYMS